MSEAGALDPSAAGAADSARILCVDDEPRVLDGLENHLAMEYEVHLATSGGDGLAILESEGPFAAVVSDMRMPQMNGARFLREVRRSFPDCTRLLLTGQADVESATAAVNEGQIFRFLRKPCAPDDLLAAVADAVHHHKLIRSERDLLENTLNGAARVLSEVIGLMAPAAFNRSSALTAYVRHMCERLDIAEPWEFELAARLSQLGCITLPDQTLDRVYAGQSLNDRERAMFGRHPEAARRLLVNIPRLERVAEMIGSQQDPRPCERPADFGCANDAEVIALGGGMLAVALAFDKLLVAGKSPEAAVERLSAKKRLARFLVELLADFETQVACSVISALPVRDLCSFMVLDEDVKTMSGQTIVGKGRVLNGPLLEKLRNFAKGIGVRQPVRVRVASSD